MEDGIPGDSSLEFLIEHAESSAGRLALRASGSDLTYSELANAVRRTAAFFARRGVVAGNRVGLLSDVDRDVVTSILALWGLGATVIPVALGHPSKSLQRMLSNVELKFLFHASELDPPDGVACENHPLETTGRSETPLIPPNPESIAMILFTSGSSGLPKAVPLTHASLNRNAWTTAEALGVTSSDRLLINTPPYTTSSIVHVLTMLSHGATTVIERGFQFGADLLSQIVTNECTGFAGVPVHFSRLLAALEESPATAQLRFLMNSGDHLPAPVVRGLQDGLPGVRIFCVYGLTEVAGRLCVLDPDLLPEKNGSVGRPLPGMKIRVRDAAFCELPPGETGEIYVTGPNLMDGYLKNAEANAAMTAHGFATGDFGYLDSDGCLFLQGRHDDVVKVGGEKVSLKLIEEVIGQISPFDDFMVGAENDEHLGPVASVFFVPRSGGDFAKGPLVKKLKRLLPRTHIPRRFVQVDAIPRTSSGKAIRPKPKRHD